MIEISQPINYFLQSEILGKGLTADQANEKIKRYFKKRLRDFRQHVEYKVYNHQITREESILCAKKVADIESEEMILLRFINYIFLDEIDSKEIDYLQEVPVRVSDS